MEETKDIPELTQHMPAEWNVWKKAQKSNFKEVMRQIVSQKDISIKGLNDLSILQLIPVESIVRLISITGHIPCVEYWSPSN